MFLTTVQCDERTAKISSDIFDYSIGIGEIGLGINVETIFIFEINESLCFLERSTDP